MIEPWVNGLAVGVFGFLTGGVAGFFAIVSGISQQTAASIAKAKDARVERRWSMSGAMDTARKRAEDGRVDWKLLPRSGKAALLAFYGLIAVMIIFIRFSPLAMNWWAFLGALFCGYAAVDLVFERARKRAGGERAAAAAR